MLVNDGSLQNVMNLITDFGKFCNDILNIDNQMNYDFTNLIIITKKVTEVQLDKLQTKNGGLNLQYEILCLMTLIYDFYIVIFYGLFNRIFYLIFMNMVFIVTTIEFENIGNIDNNKIFDTYRRIINSKFYINNKKQSNNVLLLLSIVLTGYLLQVIVLHWSWYLSFKSIYLLYGIYVLLTIKHRKGFNIVLIPIILLITGGDVFFVISTTVVYFLFTTNDIMKIGYLWILYLLQLIINLTITYFSLSKDLAVYGNIHILLNKLLLF